MDFPTIAEVFPILSDKPWFQFVFAIVSLLFVVGLGSGLDWGGTEIGKAVTRLLGKGFAKVPVLDLIGEKLGIKGSGSVALSLLLAYILAFVAGFSALDKIPALQNIGNDPELSKTLINVANTVLYFFGGKYIHDQYADK